MTDKVERILQEAREKRNQGKYDEARMILINAVAETETVNVAQLGNLYHTLGTVEQAAGAFVEAILNLQLALACRQKAGDLLGAAYTAFQIPMCCRESGEPDDFLIEEFRSARELIEKAIENPEHISPKDMGNMVHNLGFCLQIERDWQGALKKYAEALSHRYQAQDHRGAAMTLARKAECLIELGEIENARENAQIALRAFQKLGDVNRVKQAEEILRRINE